MLVAALCASADEPAPIPGSKPSTNSSPEALLARIDEVLRAIPDTEERARQFPEMKARFLESYPRDPLRWQLRFMEAMLAAQNDESEKQTAAEAIFKEILDSPESPAPLKSKVSGLILAFRYKTFLEKKCALKPFQEAVESHLKSHPNAEGNDQYARWLMEAVTPIEANARARKLEELTRSGIPHLARAAKERLELLARLEDLRKKPMEMRFTALDGREVDLCALRGKVVLLDFWASWSLESLALLPSRIAAYSKLKDRGFEIVGISFDEDRQSLLEMLAAKQITWPQFFDGKALRNPMGARYGIEGLPVSWLLDRKGMVVNTDLVTGLEREVEKLLAK
ncbi:MAG: TlpA family protein disulfide reductase [Verrucomicrobia bacterium]|nr:TlpA family protein disulfide reductase [Verrucomicrobiota bacterium]MBI3870921.1 TlpA family protein disulfide reductase [Verrucomicrobiota bacterium]